MIRGILGGVDNDNVGNTASHMIIVNALTGFPGLPFLRLALEGHARLFDGTKGTREISEIKRGHGGNGI